MAKVCPMGFRPCLRCHSGKTNGHGTDLSRVREFRPPGSRRRREMARPDNEWNHPAIGDRVRYIGVPEGELSFGGPYAPLQCIQWVRGGSEGAITRVIEGYASHRCPDHDGGIDCICADESGRVGAMMQSPVVAWETLEGGTVEHCIGPEDEGGTWERIL